MPRIHGYHLHLPLLHVDQQHNAKVLYALRVTRDMISKLAFFFLPIFLFEQGNYFFSFLGGSALSRGVVTVAGFYLLVRVVTLLATLPAARLVKKIGHHRSMIWAHLLYILFFVALHQATHWPFLLAVAAIFEGAQIALFWPSYHTFLSKYALRQHMGEDLGLQQFLLQLSALLVPALGGVVVAWFGFEYLFLSGLGFLLLALMLVLLFEPQPERDSVSWRELWEWLRDKKFQRFSLSLAGQYCNDAALVLWPLYLFFLLGSIERVGFLYTFSLFISLLLSLAVGVYLDRKHSKKPFFISGGVLSVIWLLRTQLITFWQVALVEAVDRLTGNFHWLFFNTGVYRRSKGKEAFSYFVYREIIVSAVGVLFWLGMGSIFWLFSWGWTGLFVMGSVGVVLSTLLREKLNDQEN